MESASSSIAVGCCDIGQPNEIRRDAWTESELTAQPRCLLHGATRLAEVAGAMFDDPEMPQDV